MTLQDLLAKYNAKAEKPIKAWKQSRAKLEERIAKLYGDTAPAAPSNTASTTLTLPVVTTTKEDAMTKPAAKKAPTAKKAAKKAPAKKAAKSAGSPGRSGIGAFVAEQHAAGKGVKEILEKAASKGFSTTYGSIASMISRAKK